MTCSFKTVIEFCTLQKMDGMSGIEYILEL